ncbi:MAG: carbon-nitrogen hydrolase family protein [Planctomycetales bacterium]|nr:carbon-nitrogen hydrolase family protein [Planctomycetales bacterium]
MNASAEVQPTFQVALVQMLVTGGAREENLRRAEKAIAEAARCGSQLALLPETLDLGWTHPSTFELAEPIPGGQPFARLSQAAARHGIYVCAGLTERDQEFRYNSAVLIDPTGNLLLKHRKLNELEIGHACYHQGDRLNVARTSLGTLGVMICADGYACGQVLSRSLCYMGADMILSPSAWARPASHDNTADPYGQVWREAYCPVARDFNVWFASASCVGPMTAGPWSGRNCIGCSMVVDEMGQIVLQGPYGPEAEAILYTEVHLKKRPARGTMWQAQLER